LHGLPRFSEDLDFSAAGKDDSREIETDFPERLLAGMKSDLEKAGYAITIKLRPDRTVANAFFRFEGLPAEIGWAKDPRLAVTVKVEMDMKPPKGARIETSLIQRFFPIALRHYDLPSLFAGKLHALLVRPYAKGRDWFDLVWYLTEKSELEPNLTLLQNALHQTGHREIDASRWREAVRTRMRSLNWDEVVADLQPFVERQSDLDQLALPLIEQLL
jgi:predicted nucleotidyltransferase component of viral defense system